MTDLKGKFNSRTIPENLLVAAVYFVLARLSLLLAFGNSKVFPVWAPAGFALAMMILFGYRMAPGIWLGAFIANLVVFESNHAASFTADFLASLFISAGNTAEAAAGTYMFRKFVPVIKNHTYFLKVNSI